MIVFNRVEVFSATMGRDRRSLGETVTEFLDTFEGEIVGKDVVQSSDHAFHCLSVILYLNDTERPPKRKRANRK